MNIQLSENEVRVLGVLMEKSAITPDAYPLTLNALTNACNQTSSRNPVLSLEPGAVGNAARLLEDKHLLRREQNFKSGVEKFSQRLCNTPFSKYQFTKDQFAVMTLLLLRGAQTPGELRARSGRLHSFSDNDDVSTTLQALLTHESGPLVVRLARVAGRQDAQYMHLLAGDIAVSETADGDAPAPRASTHSPAHIIELENRLSDMAKEIEELKRMLRAQRGGNDT